MSFWIGYAAGCLTAFVVVPIIVWYVVRQWGQHP